MVISEEFDKELGFDDTLLGLILLFPPVTRNLLDELLFIFVGDCSVEGANLPF